MKRFIKENKIITAIFLICFTIVLAYLLSLDLPEWFRHANDLFNIICQLSIGFIINFIFYVTQVYIPKRKKEKTCFNVISIRLSRIQTSMNSFFDTMAKKYLGKQNFTQLTDEELLDILKMMNFNDNVDVVMASRIQLSNPNFSVREWIRKNVADVELEIDYIIKNYSEYLYPSTISLLENICKSAMHQNLSKTLIALPEVSFSSIDKDCFFQSYYQMANEIENEKKKYI